MRQYYDVYCLLDDKPVLDFIGTNAYYADKKNRFPEKDYNIPIARNEAFILSNPKIRDAFCKQI